MLSKWVERLAYAMHAIAGVLLVSLMLTTMADVLSRMLFNLSDGGIDYTFFGGIEIVSYTLLFAILFSSALFSQQGQVIVDLFTEHMSSRKKEFLSGFYTIGFGFLGLGMCIGLYDAMQRVAENGETTQDLLIPLNLYLWYCGICCRGTCTARIPGCSESNDWWK